MIRTIDHFERVEGLTVRGATEKDILCDPATGAKYIAKLGGRNNDLEVMTEYAIFLVARQLGVPVAEGSIGRYHGRLRFLSRYFLDVEAAEELVHGVQLFTELYDERAVHEVLGNPATEQSLFTVQAIKEAFGAHYVQYGPKVEDLLFGGLVAMLTHDAMLGVMDRHHENWGLIVKRGVADAPPRFAPLYDSARGLFCNAPEQQLAAYWAPGGSQKLDGYVSKARPFIGFRGLEPRGRRHINHAELIAALYRAYPENRPRIEQILQAYDWRAADDALTELCRYGLCSGRRRSLMLTSLRRRIRSVWKAIHGS